MNTAGMKAEKDLYHMEIGRFSDLLKANRRYAFDRYGWTYFHSLPPAEKHQLRQELGWQDTTALDHYNSGAEACRGGKMDKGLQLLEKAREMGLDIPELWFNLALAYEKLGNTKDAKKYWQLFVEKIEARIRVPKRYRDDMDEVREHLATM